MSVFDDEARFRPARVLIGWMDPAEATLTLAGRVEEEAGRPEHEVRARQARTVAAARSPAIETTGVVSEPPASFRDYISRFSADPRAAPVFADGFRIALV